MALGARPGHRGQPHHQPAAARADHRRGRPGRGRPARRRAVGVGVPVLPVRSGCVVVADPGACSGCCSAAAPAGHVLFTCREIPLPRLGRRHHLLGPVSAEAVLGGLYDGLRLATMLICVGAANALANPKRLLQGRAQRPVRGRARRSSSRCRSRPSWSRASCGCAGPGGCAAGRQRGLPGAARDRDPGAERRARPVAARSPRRWTPAATAARSGQPGAAGVAHRRAASLGGLLGVCVGIYGLLDGTHPGWPRRCRCWLLGRRWPPARAARWAAGGSARTRYRPDPWRLPEWLVAGSGVVAGGGRWCRRRVDPRQPRTRRSTRSRWPALPLGAALSPCSSRCCRRWLAPPPVSGCDRARRAGPVRGPVIRFDARDGHLRRGRRADAARRRPHRRRGRAVPGRRAHRVGQVHPARRHQRAGAALHRRPAGRPGHRRRPGHPDRTRRASWPTSSASSARTRWPASSPTPSRRSWPTAWSSWPCRPT